VHPTFGFLQDLEERGRKGTAVSKIEPPSAGTDRYCRVENRREGLI
jgi:hypothetical protein